MKSHHIVCLLFLLTILSIYIIFDREWLKSEIFGCRFCQHPNNAIYTGQYWVSKEWFYNNNYTIYCDSHPIYSRIMPIWTHKYMNGGVDTREEYKKDIWNFYYWYNE